jgi:hypothetical protein
MAVSMVYFICFLSVITFLNHCKYAHRKSFDSWQVISSGFVPGNKMTYHAHFRSLLRDSKRRQILRRSLWLPTKSLVADDCLLERCAVYCSRSWSKFQKCLQPTSSGRWVLTSVVVISGLLISMLTIGTKLRWFKPSRGGWISRVIKIRRTTSFWREVKTLAPTRKISRHVKEPFEVWKRYFVRQNHNFLLQFNVLCY